MRDDRERLLDILEAIECLERYAHQGREAFLQNELLQTWVVHHTQIIGEAARQVSETFRTAHPEIPWPPDTARRQVERTSKRTRAPTRNRLSYLATVP